MKGLGPPLAAPLTHPVRDLPETPVIPGDWPKSGIWKRPRRYKGVLFMQTGTPSPTPPLDEPLGNWEARSCMVYNCTNQWLHQPDADIFIPPNCYFGPFPLPDSTGAARLEVLFPNGVAAIAAVATEKAIAWFFENETTGPFVAFTFVGP